MANLEGLFEQWHALLDHSPPNPSIIKQRYSLLASYTSRYLKQFRWTQNSRKQYIEEETAGLPETKWRRKMDEAYYSYSGEMENFEDMVNMLPSATEQALKSQACT